MSVPQLLEAFYVALALPLAVFGLHRLSLLVRFRWKGKEPSDDRPLEELPVVTVQLPLYDERTVAARLVRAAGALDWPQERLEIQVLDDSTDETREIVEREVAALCARGIDAVVLRRPDRSGFKAGALAHGLAHARGGLLCVFDADFLPAPDFLRRTVPQLADPRVGMVQARWEHLNRDESALTRAQAALLDGHFVIEHKVRHDRGLFFNFNGTAGVWRREAIEDAGGWQHDTLTEDLDLSYRAQLAGWRFRYLPLVAAPAEVPGDLAAFRSQQQRWAKGSVQVARKLGGRLLRAHLPVRVKLEAATHLCAYASYPAMLLLALLMPLGVLAPPRSGSPWLSVLSFLWLAVFAFYETSERALGRGLPARLRDVFSALALGIGMSVSLTRAALEGAFQRAGEFVRTPKRGDARITGYRGRLTGLPGLELVVAAWIAFGFVQAVRAGLWGALPFLALFLWGFAWVGVLSVRESRSR